MGFYEEYISRDGLPGLPDSVDEDDAWEMLKSGDAYLDDDSDAEFYSDECVWDGERLISLEDWDRQQNL